MAQIRCLFRFLLANLLPTYPRYFGGRLATCRRFGPTEKSVATRLASRRALRLRLTSSDGICLVASGLVRPGTIYQAMMALLEPPGSALTDRLQYPLHVRASLSRDGVELASSVKTMARGDIQMMMMKVRRQSDDDDNKVRKSDRAVVDPPHSDLGVVKN